MFYQILLSPQVERCAIITYKHGIYALPHEFPNELRLGISGWELGKPWPIFVPPVANRTWLYQKYSTSSNAQKSCPHSIILILSFPKFFYDFNTLHGCNPVSKLLRLWCSVDWFLDNCLVSLKPLLILDKTWTIKKFLFAYLVFLLYQ